MQIISPLKSPYGREFERSGSAREQTGADILRKAVEVNTPSVCAGGVVLEKMFGVCVLMACLLCLPRGEAELRTNTRRYKPVIQVTEEIDINDITFTTSAPEIQDAGSYYGGNGKVSYGRPTETSPSALPHAGHKDRYGAPVRYKPYKVIKVQDGFRPVPYKPWLHEKNKLQFEQPTAVATYSAAEPPKYSAKIVPFSSHLPTKAPTRASGLQSQDKNFIPSPTFSPTVLAHLNSENNQKFAEPSDVKPFTTQRVIDWPKPTKKSHHIKKGKKIPENHYSGDVSEEFPAAPEHKPSPSASYSDSPQQSESLLSEISTIHRGGGSANNLDDVADSLDLKTGERVEFQMYGMDGPKSYKFGFDTGKGHNRHFRFEERDGTGKVKGHYGYLDEDGKMRIMKYEADPITGFHAGPVEISPDDN